MYNNVICHREVGSLGVIHSGNEFLYTDNNNKLLGNFNQRKTRRRVRGNNMITMMKAAHEKAWAVFWLIFRDLSLVIWSVYRINNKRHLLGLLTTI